MLSLIKEHARSLRHAMKARRIGLCLKQSEAAARAGISLRTLQHFEQSGEMSIERLLKLLVVYRMDRKIVDAFKDRSWWTIEELERAEIKKKVR